MKKALRITMIALLVIAVVSSAVITMIWHNEISSVISFHQIRDRNDAHLDSGVYEMTIKGGFYLEDFIAQGGVSDDTDLIAFVIDHITKGIIPVTIKNPEIGCASFTADTADGDHLFARNYDMHKSNTCIIHTEATKDRHATISTVDLGLLGIDADKDVTGLMDKLVCLAGAYAPLDGMNDAGVSCGVYMTYQGDDSAVTATNQDTDKPDFTSTTFLRLVLDYADDLEDAVEIAKSYDMHDSAKTSYHYMVADASGRSAIFEWVGDSDETDTDGAARQLVITYNDDDSNIGEAEGASDFQWITNFIIQPDYYSNEEDMKGLDRYDHIYERLSAVDGIVENEESAMEILGEVGRRTWKSDGVCITVHSAVYNMTDKSVCWVPNENYADSDAWFRYSFK